MSKTSKYVCTLDGVCQRGEGACCIGCEDGEDGSCRYHGCDYADCYEHASECPYSSEE